MCGIVAYQSKDPKAWHFDILARLLRESSVRGLHAFGMSYLRDGKVHTVKSHSVDDLISLLGSPAFSDRLPYALIAHNRYSTSGDWNDHANNQPIVSVENGETTSLIFNGVVSQGTREDWVEEFGRRYVTDNDGEVVLREFIEREPSDFLRWFNKQRFSFAGFVLSSQSGLWWIRNRNRPMWFAENEGFTFWASTKDILARSSVPGDYIEQLPNKLGGCLATAQKLREDAGLLASSVAV